MRNPEEHVKSQNTTGDKPTEHKSAPTQVSLRNPEKDSHESKPMNVTHMYKEMPEDGGRLPIN